MDEVADEIPVETPTADLSEPEEDCELSWLMAKNSKDEVESILMLELRLVSLQFYESILNQLLSIVLLSLVTQVEEVDVKEPIFGVEITIGFLYPFVCLVEVFDALEAGEFADQEVGDYFKES